MGCVTSQIEPVEAPPPTEGASVTMTPGASPVSTSRRVSYSYAFPDFDPIPHTLHRIDEYTIPDNPLAGLNRNLVRHVRRVIIEGAAVTPESVARAGEAVRAMQVALEGYKKDDRMSFFSMRVDGILGVLAFLQRGYNSNAIAMLGVAYRYIHQMDL